MTTQPPSNLAVEDLLKSLRHTAASRFNAAKRLEERERQLTYLIAVTSVFLIAINLVPYFFHLESDTVGHLNFFTVSLSIAILALSLLQRSYDDSAKAEQHHRSALEINELRREIIARREFMSADDFVEFSRKYNAILQKYSINHDDIDYLKVKIERKGEFPWLRPWQRGLMMLRIFIIGRKYYIAAGIGVVLLIWILFGGVVPLTGEAHWAGSPGIK